MPILIAGYICLSCNCKGTVGDIKKLVHECDLIFEGNLVNIAHDSATQTYTVTFRVTRIYKGDKQLKSVSVKSTNAGDCELLIDRPQGDDAELIGRHYLIYVNKGAEGYVFDYCNNWVVSDSYIDNNIVTNTYKRKKDSETTGWFREEVGLLNSALKQEKKNNRAKK
ncbi:MAG TPA: hypothetical protein VK806_06310 [Bacteroidia bacterium]|nr:hypothetical protein [Bacteroidia bacterium]